MGSEGVGFVERYMGSSEKLSNSLKSLYVSRGDEGSAGKFTMFAQVIEGSRGKSCMLIEAGPFAKVGIIGACLLLSGVLF